LVLATSFIGGYCKTAVSLELREDNEIGSRKTVLKCWNALDAITSSTLDLRGGRSEAYFRVYRGV